MKKRIFSFFILICILIFICIIDVDSLKLQIEQITGYATDTEKSEEENNYVRSMDGTTSEEIDIQSNTRTTIVPVSSGLMDKYCYAYNLLDDSQKEIYIQIYEALIHYEEESEVSTLDKEVLNEVYQCVMNDHPEIFYINGYQYIEYTIKDEIVKLAIKPNYIMESETIQNYQHIIDQYVEKCFSTMPDIDQDYEKIKYLYEYIITNTEYCTGAENSQNICSVMVSGKSVCQGYAKAMQYLCSQCGIKATLVTGYAKEGSHAWTLVYADDNPYYVDVTWGDASYVLKGDVTRQDTSPDVTYDYLLVTTKMLLETHTIDNVVPMPVCECLDDNYYVREGYYFTSYNETKMSEVFAKAIYEGRNYITIKCSDNNVYQVMKEQMITQKRVYNYIDYVDGAVAYTENPAQLTICFMIV